MVKNYCQDSLLPICSKYLSISFLMTYLNTSKKQSFFLCFNQILSWKTCVSNILHLTHDIYKAFDCSPSFEVQGVFLDISKAFDKVWYDGLLCKRKRNSINGDLLKFIERFLSDRYQRAVLNEQTSKWNKIKTEIPQGSILGLLFFLIY